MMAAPASASSTATSIWRSGRPAISPSGASPTAGARRLPRSPAAAAIARTMRFAKYVALREAGLPESDVRLVIVRDLAKGVDHAVAAARIDERWVMLDNRRLILVEDNAMARAVPLFVFDETGVKRFTTSVAETERLPATAQTFAATPSEFRR